MAKDKDTPKKEKKSKKIKSTDLAKELGDPANTSTDIILSPALDKPRESLGGADDEDFYESRLPAQAPFAQPLAPKKLNKKVLKTIKKGTTHPPYPYRADFSLAIEGNTTGSQRSGQSTAKRRERVHSSHQTTLMCLGWLL